jgi:hypothetical protein
MNNRIVWIIAIVVIVVIVGYGINSAMSPPDFATAPLTNQSVYNAVNGHLQDGNNISVTLNNGNVTINYAESDGLYTDETDLVEFMATDSAYIMPKLFSNPNVSNVTLTRYVYFTGAYGNQTLEPAVSMTITRDTENKINWNNMQNEPYQNIYDIADSYYIAPSIYYKLPANIGLSQNSTS